MRWVWRLLSHKGSPRGPHSFSCYFSPWFLLAQGGWVEFSPLWGHLGSHAKVSRQILAAKTSLTQQLSKQALGCLLLCTSPSCLPDSLNCLWSSGLFNFPFVFIQDRASYFSWMTVTSTSEAIHFKFTPGFICYPIHKNLHSLPWVFPSSPRIVEHCLGILRHCAPLVLTPSPYLWASGLPSLSLCFLSNRMRPD
jgi:hypothetical protein